MFNGFNLPKKENPEGMSLQGFRDLEGRDIEIQKQKYIDCLCDATTKERLL
jgi:hypothetical protein